MKPNLSCLLALGLVALGIGMLADTNEPALPEPLRLVRDKYDGMVNFPPHGMKPNPAYIAEVKAFPNALWRTNRMWLEETNEPALPTVSLSQLRDWGYETNNAQGIIITEFGLRTVSTNCVTNLVSVLRLYPDPTPCQLCGAPSHHNIQLGSYESWRTITMEAVLDGYTNVVVVRGPTTNWIGTNLVPRWTRPPMPPQPPRLLP